MPSSLVFTALVVSWLAVLVPVVARRRQLVPRPAEADLCSRVIVRSARTSPVKEVVVSHQVSQGRRGSAAGGTGLVERPAPGEPDDVDDDRWDDLDDDGTDRAGADPDDLDRDGYDDGGDRSGRRTEPKAFRPGRGGFDADAAREAAGARYATRRHTALGLIVVVALSGLLALVAFSAAWWIFGIAVAALAGYLVFLRRQTRLEEELRERRTARLRGERRAHRPVRVEEDLDDDGHLTDPDLHLDDRDDLDDLDDEGLADADEELRDEDVRVSAHAEPGRAASRPSGATVAGPRWAAPRTPAPPVPDGLELVEDSDDDPAFHDLPADRYPAYRRAAGA